MINLTEVNGTSCHINEMHIEKMNRTADTHILMINGHFYNVVETPEEIIEKIVTWRLSLQKAQCSCR